MSSNEYEYGVMSFTTKCYCEDCRIKNHWPPPMIIGWGGPLATCELCGTATKEMHRHVGDGWPMPLLDPLGRLWMANPYDSEEKAMINAVVERLNLISEKLGLIWSDRRIKWPGDSEAKET